MTEYIFLLLGVLVISFVAGMIAPESSIKRYISMLVSLCLISAVLGPVGELIESAWDKGFDIPSVNDTESDYSGVFNETLISGNETSFCALLKLKMSGELGIPDEQFDVFADMCISEGEYKLESLSIMLYGKGITQDPARIRQYTRDLLGVECEIIYG